MNISDLTQKRAQMSTSFDSFWKNRVLSLSALHIVIYFSHELSFRIVHRYFINCKSLFYNFKDLTMWHSSSSKLHLRLRLHNSITQRTKKNIYEPKIIDI